MADSGGDCDQTCVADDVVVAGKQAVWIFSEFETKKSLEKLVAWLTPDDWPSWGSSMFKEMKQLSPRTVVPSATGQQWHANYLEVVSLAGKELSTVLRCDFKRTSEWAAMTYDLDHSVGDMLQVDRGYLLAYDVAGTRRVKALKVVGFTNTVLNVLATEVCPEWGDWVRQATTTAATELTGRSTGPKRGAVGDDATARSGSTADKAADLTQGYAERWVSTVTDMAQFYGPYASDVGSRLWSGKYTQADAAQDSTRLFLRVARDWSQAWQAGTEMAANFAESEVPPTGGADPGSGSLRSIEFTKMDVPPQVRDTTVSVTDLARVGLPAATIKASALTVEPTTIGPDTETVTIEADTTDVPCGLYEGSLLLGPTGRPSQVPALFYVSNARPGA
jgi:hypothetical protein